MTTILTAFSKRTAESIYLEYLNDWLTVSRMAENYGRTEEEMKRVIDKGRDEHIVNIAKKSNHNQ